MHCILIKNKKKKKRTKKKTNPKKPKNKTHLCSKGFLLGEKAGLFFSICYHGHLSKDSIFLLEPSSTAEGKKSCHLP